MQTFKTSKSKENILARIRKELNKASVSMPYPELEKRQSDKIYTSSGMSDEEKFAESFNALGGKFVFCANKEELVDKLYSLHENRGWKKMLCSEQDILEALNTGGSSIALSSQGNPEDAEACITGCELLVARTGSVILSSRQNMGRTSSVFYPVHIIVAYTGQVVHDIGDAINTMKKKYGSDMPSMINLNTGPSRTADIEKTLVVGVHGPGEVFCFLVNDI
ncbi:MAG: lactate utilization protein [Chitinophagaceae bacterium]|nr:lactate utilization protein [Chitinophagaceae bacterium]MCB9047569.1 lactate utilization protein [Chitinophagales bacterium]